MEASLRTGPVARSQDRVPGILPVGAIRVHCRRWNDAFDITLIRSPRKRGLKRRVHIEGYTGIAKRREDYRCIVYLIRRDE
jgi:hypothetical protein